VHVLIGNHELFGAERELQWVSEAAYAAFEGTPGLNLDASWLAELPEPKRARSAALASGGYYARKMAEFPAVLRIGNTIFAHGGVTPYWAEYGIDRINEEISHWFAGETDQPRYLFFSHVPSMAPPKAVGNRPMYDQYVPPPGATMHKPLRIKTTPTTNSSCLFIVVGLRKKQRQLI